MTTTKEHIEDVVRKSNAPSYWTKKALNLVVGVGVTKIVHAIVQNNTVAELTLPQRIAVAVSSVVIGAMAKEATEKFTDKKVDDMFDWWNENVKPKLVKKA